MGRHSEATTLRYVDLFHYKERENDSHTPIYDPHDRWNNNAGGTQRLGKEGCLIVRYAQ